MEAEKSLAPKVIEIHHPAAKSRGIKLSLLDISNLHPLASGNKLFKLSLNLDDAIENKCSHVLSFGGAFSNHIHALALYGASKGLKTIGIIRGESEYINNPTLQVAKHNGMTLEFVDRQTYRLRDDPSYLEHIAKKYPNAFIIPEGGSNALAVKGCKQLAQMINTQLDDVDIVAVACGTGGTLAGLVCGLRASQEQLVLGFPVVRDPTLSSKIDHLLREVSVVGNAEYELILADYGGYAKIDKELVDFILSWLDKTDVLLDPIYTSKMCRKLIELIENNETPEVEGKHICLLHTGGLQAWQGMRDKVIKISGESAWGKIEEELIRRN